MLSTLDHVISQIISKEHETLKQTVLNQVIELHNSFTTLEYYNIRKLLVLYAYLSDLAIDNPLTASDELLKASEKSTISGSVHTQLRLLERILNLPDNVPINVDGYKLVVVNAYGYRSYHCEGRIYGHINTMTLLSRQCRYYLFNDIYFDLDLVNAHPTILFSYAKENNIEAKILERYVFDREGFLQEVVSKDKITRSEAKIAILRCLNLVSDVSLPATLKPLHSNILPIRNHLYQTNISQKVTNLGDYTMSRESFKGKSLERQKISLQAQYCASEESRCLEVLYEVCLHKGNLDRNVALNKTMRNISFIPFFDGAYIYFNNLSKKSEVQQILDDTNELISPNSFELKDMKPEWSYIIEGDLKIYEIIESHIGSLSDSDFSKLLSYINIEPFSLDNNELKKIISSISTSDEKKKLEEGFNEDLNSLIRESAKIHKYKVRRKLLSIIKKGGLNELLEYTKSKPDEKHTL